MRSGCVNSWVLITLFGLGCSEPKSSPEPKPSQAVVLNAAMERPEFADPAWATRLMDRLREQLDGDPLPSHADEADEGDELAIVCSYFGIPIESACALGEGATMEKASSQAIEGLRSRLKTIPARHRLTLDIVIHRTPERLTTMTPQRRREQGLKGYLLHSKGERSFVLPSRILTAELAEEGETLYGVSAKRLQDEFRRNNAALEVVELGADLIGIRTAKWVEPTISGREATRLYRAHAYEAPALEPDQLLERIVWAADHLVSTVDEQGRVRYLYSPRLAQELPGYNLLRHAGTTYSMLQAYRRVGDEMYLDAAGRAVAHLMQQTRRERRMGVFGGGEVLFVVEGEHIKLGGAGLGLVMLVEYMEATGSREYLSDAQAFARFLVAMQREDGEFISLGALEEYGEPSANASAYYPGEAILGLMRLHALDGDPLWLSTAIRGADWLIQVRDAGKSVEELANDHWLMIGLSHLTRETKSRHYIEHSLTLARAVAVQQERTKGYSSAYLDYLGGFYEPPRSTPAATRAEGLVAVLDTCALAELPCDWVLTLLQSTERHALLSQYTPSTVWWMSSPESVVGGFAGGIMDLKLRNDFTQHNLSAMLGLERHLRDAEHHAGLERDGPRRAIGVRRLDAQKLMTLRAPLLASRPSTSN